MTEVSSSESKPKKSVSRKIAITLSIICIILIVSTVTVVTLLANITQKYDQENTLLQCCEDSRAIPSNLDSLFQNKIVIWKNRQATEPSGNYTNFTFLNFFNYTGCLLINITSSISFQDMLGISWTNQKGSGFPQFLNSTFNSWDFSEEGLFPVLPSNSLEVYIGNIGVGYGATQNVTLTYYY